MEKATYQIMTTGGAKPQQGYVFREGVLRLGVGKNRWGYWQLTELSTGYALGGYGSTTRKAEIDSFLKRSAADRQYIVDLVKKANVPDLNPDIQPRDALLSAVWGKSRPVAAGINSL